MTTIGGSLTDLVQDPMVLQQVQVAIDIYSDSTAVWRRVEGEEWRGVGGMMHCNVEVGGGKGVELRRRGGDASLQCRSPGSVTSMAIL